MTESISSIRHVNIMAGLWQRWSGRLTFFLSAQFMVQCVNACTGLVLVRCLPKTEYSWYTMVAASIASLSVMSDSGIGIAVISRAGACWQSSTQLGALVSSGMRIRRRMLAIVGIITLPLFIVVLIRTQASPVIAIGLSLMGFLAVVASSTTALLQVANRIHSRVREIATGELIAAIAKLAVIVVGVGVGFASAGLAVSATLAGAVVLYLITTRQVATLFDSNAIPTPDDNKEIVGTMRRCMANSIFVCVQSNIAIWILGFGGQTARTADFGALSRFAILFTLISSIMANIVGPAYARASTARQLFTMAASVLAAYVAFVVLAISASLLVPDVFLWILGKKYQHLAVEMPLMFALLGCGGLSQVLWTLVMSRGWMKHSWTQIPLTVCLQIVLAFVLPIGSLAGVVMFSCFSLVPAMLVGLCLLVQGVRGARIEEWCRTPSGKRRLRYDRVD